MAADRLFPVLSYDLFQLSVYVVEPALHLSNDLYTRLRVELRPFPRLGSKGEAERQHEWTCSLRNAKWARGNRSYGEEHVSKTAAHTRSTQNQGVTVRPPVYIQRLGHETRNSS